MQGEPNLPIITTRAVRRLDFPAISKMTSSVDADCNLGLSLKIFHAPAPNSNDNHGTFCLAHFLSILRILTRVVISPTIASMPQTDLPRRNFADLVPGSYSHPRMLLCAALKLARHGSRRHTRVTQPQRVCAWENYG